MDCCGFRSRVVKDLGGAVLRARELSSACVNRRKRERTCLKNAFDVVLHVLCVKALDDKMICVRASAKRAGEVDSEAHLVRACAVPG